MSARQRILPAILSMIVGCGHASESLAYLLTGASVRGSSANVALEQHTPLGKDTSTNSLGQIVVVVGGVQRNVSLPKLSMIY